VITKPSVGFLQKRIQPRAHEVRIDRWITPQKFENVVIVQILERDVFLGAGRAGDERPAALRAADQHRAQTEWKLHPPDHFGFFIEQVY